MSRQMNSGKALALPAPFSRAKEYLALTKPGLTLMSVATAVGGSSLALGDSTATTALLHTFLGTLLVGAGAGTLNQFSEREHDALMTRTALRPLPSGRVTPSGALLFGMLLSIVGVAYLALFTNLLAALLAATTLVTYLFVYTPLKRVTPFAVVLGGIPGALPPMIGWAAVRGDVSIGAWSLFAILFFWQMPHFLALAWLWRDDYARAGYRMLTVVDTRGVVTRRQILVYSLALLPASVLPTYAGVLGPFYFVGAGTLSLGFLLLALRLFREHSNAHARQLFLGSLLYLPFLVLLMILDRM